MNLSILFSDIYWSHIAARHRDSAPPASVGSALLRLNIIALRQSPPSRNALFCGPTKCESTKRQQSPNSSVSGTEIADRNLPNFLSQHYFVTHPTRQIPLLSGSAERDALRRSRGAVCDGYSRC